MEGAKKGEWMNLLTDAVFNVGRDIPLSLPGVFAACARGESISFVRLRAHQRTAWHTFRVQLAALALRNWEGSKMPVVEAEWVLLLRKLTSSYGDDPWRLFVDDRTRPAFMQAADPGKLKWELVSTPDALDMLITARNHDLKSAVMQNSTVEDWVFALVTLQTSEGYGGRNNYGVMRMNGGSSSRPFLGLAPSGGGNVPDVAAWWARDVRLLASLESREVPVMIWGGIALLWCEPWLEGQEIATKLLDPWVIEICRRVRLIYRNGRLCAESTGSKAARVAGKHLNGVVGDPWVPVSKVDPNGLKALTLGESRFDYTKLFELLLSGNWDVPAAAVLQMGEQADELLLVAEALSRGNSKTDGWKSRVIPLPRRAISLFLTEADFLRQASVDQMDEIRFADLAVRDAIAVYSAGGDRSVKLSSKHYSRARQSRDRLSEKADHVFFEYLWMRASAQANRAVEGANAISPGVDFRAYLVDVARIEVERAFEAVPCSSIHQPRARTRARSRLHFLLKKSGLLRSEHPVQVVEEEPTS